MTTAKKALPIFLIVVFILSLLEAITAIASRRLNFNYSCLSPIAFLAYMLVAYFIARKTDRKTGIIYAALVGFFDATVGWSISTLLKANTGNVKVEITIGIWIITAIIVSLTASLFGFLGAWAATYKYKAKSMNR